MTIVALLIVVAMWAGMTWHTKEFDATSLECLFTGLGFVAVIFTLRRDRKDSDAKELEHRQVLRALVLQSRLQVYQWQLQNKTENADVLCRTANDYDRALRQLEELSPLPGSLSADQLDQHRQATKK